MIKLNNTNSVSLSATNVIPLNLVFNTNNNTSFSNNAVSLNKGGYYNINAMFTLTGATVGDYAIQVYNNGSPISDAIATGTIATANDVLTLTLTDVERVVPQIDTTKAQITFVLVQATGTVSLTNANVSVVTIK